MAQLTLAKDSKSLYPIVIAQNASESIRTVAANLRKYLNKMTGARFSIRTDAQKPAPREICVGPTRRAAFSFSGRNREEFYRIAVQGERLFLIGGGDRGTMYAVNSFLELLGVRFFTPDCERVPQAQTLAYDHQKDIYYKPIVEFRDENWAMALDSDWCEKQKINCHGDRELPIAGGKGYFGWFVHTIGDLAEMTPPFMNKQPCLTDDKVFETVLKNVKKRFEKFPGNNIISVSQNDGTRGDAVCQCEKCREINEREGTLMGTTLYMANRVARAIRDEYPDVLVDTLSYNFTTEAPKYMMPEDNVVIRFVTAFCCIHHALEDARLSPGAGSETKSVRFNENLKKWQKMAKTLYMWYYTTSFSNCLAPLPNFEAFRKDMAYLTKNKVRGFFLQGNNKTSGEFDELRAYICAKLLWQPKMSKKEYWAMIDEFLEGYYGAAAPFVRGYLDLLMETEPDTHFHLYGDPLQIAPPRYRKINGRDVLDTSFIDRGKELWDAAENAVREHPKELKRVKKARIQHLYYEINVRFATIASTPDPRAEMKKLERLNRKLNALLKRFHIDFIAENNRRAANPDFQNTPLQWGAKN